ncbi:hypothetical protein [Xanthomonas floridensis]|uniref:Uncharacterized protein n=1 Tax=Xanthomonas floridensis TaxID=1843580 RepID=A0A1A9M5Y5_9XANT|nr:hypothetical protein [Xanthomonas floridensis]MEA5125746.1 hypothetical protein [Xanthomonas floridensis]MEA5133691.1 hypothetical protein [Xanthomonas floridensis]OAG65411.1 hypothetical protein A7D17_09495 [Xanthomonas floridensis]
MQSKDVQARDADGDPIYRRNPRPTQAYRITMTIENAPGPFDFVDGAAFYQMTNHTLCTPIEPIAGVWSKQKEDSVPAVFKKIDTTTYVATIFADGMIDADYYGKGVCHWELMGVGISLKANGKKEETNFSPGLEKDQILSSGRKTTYFWKGGYPRDELEDFPDTGEGDPAKFKGELRGELFKVTLSARKEVP